MKTDQLRVKYGPFLETFAYFSVCCCGPTPRLFFVAKRVRSVEEIDWSELLPLKNNSQWIEVDLESKRLDMDPAAGVADSS